MTEQDVAKLKAAGFTDADIAEYQANEGKQGASAAPVNPQAPVSQDLPEIDVTQKSETLKNAEQAGVATTNEGSWKSDAMALGSAVAPYVLPVAGGALGLYGAGKVGGWGREIGKGVQAMAEAQRASAAAQQATAEGLQQRFNQRMAAQQGARPLSPVNPQATYNVPTQNVPQTRAPIPGPVAPQGMPAAAPAQVAQAVEQPNVIQRGMDMASKVRQAAAQRIAGFAPQVAEAAGTVGRTVAPALGAAGRALSAANPYITAAQGLTYSKNLGPDVPMKGPYRGMEINPNTGRPWSKPELDLINR